MDFGVLDFDGMVDSENDFLNLDPEIETVDGSGSNKQGRSESGEADWMGVKLARADDLLTPKTMQIEQRDPSLQRSNSLFPDNQPQQKMLSFSSPKSDTFTFGSVGGLLERSLNSKIPLSYSYRRSAGIRGVFAGFIGPFTPNQWMELEQQALIYKYMEANVPIPSNLLISLKRNIIPNGLSGFGGSFRPNTMGWSPYPLGFSSNTDPEPGRCRRTDGKKWRCSRDAVAEQKYCERHVNRGRHRSRKPVEGQTGHAGSGPDTTKVIPMANNSSASVVAGGSASNSLNIAQHQVKILQPGAADPSTNTQINNRDALNKDNMGNRIQESQGLSMLSPSMNLEPIDTPFSIPKQHNPFAEYVGTEFGLVPSASLLNPLESNSYMNCQNFCSASELNGPESQDQLSLSHFVDEFSKNLSDRSSINWPEIGEIQSDPNQLSTLIPVVSDISTESPNHDKFGLSPLRFAHEFDPIHMELGVDNFLNEPINRETNWNPFAWETSIGGPLGEVFNNTNNTTGDGKNPGVNLMSGWDGSSPTWVLQKTSFGSLSNGSTGSNPRAETNQTHDKVGLCDDLLGSTLFNFPSIPTM